MNTLVFYLSGPIDKSNGKINEFFRDLGATLQHQGATVLTPEIRPDDVSAPLAVYLRDVAQAALADIIVVDSRESCGLGVGAEIMSTLCCGGLAYFISPPNSHYRRDQVNILGRVGENWTHPFVHGMAQGKIISDATIQAVLEVLPQSVTELPARPVCPAYLAELIKNFVQTGLSGDQIMKNAIVNNARLGRRIEEVVGEI